MASQVERWIDGHTAAGEEAEEKRMSDIVIRPPDPQEIRNEYSSILARAEMISIEDIESHKMAMMCFVGLKKARKFVENRVNPIISDQNRAHKRLVGLRTELLAPIDAAAKLLAGKLNTYENKQRVIAEKASEDSPVEIEPEIANVEGISTRTTYKVMVRDIVLLGEFAVKNPQWVDTILPNMPLLNSLARSQREAFNIPGCELVVEKSKIVRSA